jgi:hypothetical protein
MSEQELVEARVVEARLHTTEEKILLEEIKARQQSTLNTVRAAFQHLITLSVSLIGLQIGILKFSDFQISSPLIMEGGLVLSSFSLLFASAIISFVGQISGIFSVPTLNTLQTYRTFREGRLKRTYPLYVLANLLFIGGLAMFIIGFIMIGL